MDQDQDGGSKRTKDHKCYDTKDISLAHAALKFLKQHYESKTDKKDTFM